MNPPSALAGAMSRDRKPFTYTPGGLDLSEIKSEKMAKRLMRNAMNQGVPERPQQLQSPPTPTTHIAVPNYNCLPVQVFPTFNLPANPKSLLRTRSIPGQPRDPPLEKAPEPQFISNEKPITAPQTDIFNKNTPSFAQINNNRPASIFENTLTDSRSLINYGSGGHTIAFPQTNYDVPDYMREQPPEPNVNIHMPSVLPPAQIESCFNNNYISPKAKDAMFIQENLIPTIITEGNDTVTNKEVRVIDPTPDIEKPVQDDRTSTEQNEVRVIKKQVKQETSVKETNGTQNGDADTEAEMTVMLPKKKSASKTETKVEVSTKTLPDGSVEEVKKTITTTMIDGKTEIRTKTETRIIPKEGNEADEEEEEVVEEEEEEEEEHGEIKGDQTKKSEITVVSKNEPKENGHTNVIKTEESSETSTTSSKRIVVVQDDEEEEVDEDELEEIDAEPVTFVIKQAVENDSSTKVEEKEEETKDEPTVEEVKELELADTEIEEDIKKQKETPEEVEEKTKHDEEEEVEEVEEEEQYEEAEEPSVKEELETSINKDDDKLVMEEESKTEDSQQETEDGAENSKVEVNVKIKEDAEEKTKDEEVEVKVTRKLESPIESSITSEDHNNSKTEVTQQEVHEEKQEMFIQSEEVKSEKPVEVILTPKIEATENKSMFREPSLPLEKVEDIEIKPIGAGDFTKSHTQTTEIIANAGDIPSIVTKYNRTETIETVKRSIETLDPNPPISFFTPHVEKISLPPQPQRPYQPVYPSEPTTERRHSLLLERLSMERQLPTEVYQNTGSYTTQTTEQGQWSQEPQAEILEVANVKPSTITNQQWFQQSNKEVYSNSTSTNQSNIPIWVQPQSQPQGVYSSQPQYRQPSPQPQYQPKLSPQPQYQRQPSPQPQYQQTSPQPQYPPQSPQPQYLQQSPQPQYQQPLSQPQYHQPTLQQQSTASQYQPTLSTNTQQTSSIQQTFSSYTPKAAAWTPSSSTVEKNSQSNQYSSYQSTQQFSSSYVPPPWEQDSNYVADSQNYIQTTPQTSLFSPTPSQGWKQPPSNKFSKPPPKAYIPPKPNQSFVKPVVNVEPPRLAGRKTYYSEYERRYITVPESTYVPAESKFQVQPDPSPQYYYDNNEPAEQVEHQWRKELREFTEKTQTTQTESSVKPPWEKEAQFAKTPDVVYTPTPSWSQTVRPQSWRERSFESEFVSQEWPKTNTLGRGRPLSSYGKETIPERTRGVSVDRYNPNSYQAPVAAEHPPVQTFTHNPPAPHATGYHNTNAPAYHGRASAEPREQQVQYQQPRTWRQHQATPIQSRSFKYLQWITGTDD